MKILKKIKNFAISLFKHTKNGMPKATQFTIDTRHIICLSCSSYNKEDKECSECGCSLSRKKEFMNKLAWQDQRCPLGKW